MLQLIFTLLLFAACARAPLNIKEDALHLAQFSNTFSDDLDFKSLIQGIRDQVAIFKNQKQDLIFGTQTIRATDYAQALEKLLAHSKNSTEFSKHVQEHFELYEVYGRENWGEVLITSYYEPVIKGSATKKAPFTQPLYDLPKDLVYIDWASFTQIPQEQLEKPLTVRGRLVTDKSGPWEKKKLIPYPTREEIEKETLKYQSNILCYVDPVEAFFLQIQGSGTIHLTNGKKLRLGYAGQNGQPYQAIGKFLTDRIPLEKMTMQKIEEYLHSLPKEELQDFLNKNPSYVFFHKLSGSALTHFGTPVIAGRTIATDAKYFPKGTLAYMEFPNPELASNGQIQSWKKTSRFVFDQDRGGAINGGGRVDLFWGTGEEAKKYAGVMKTTGKLYYLVPKLPETLKE